MKVLLIGPHPPPLGGVAVFIKRYKAQLESEGHEVDLLDRARFRRSGFYRRLLRAPLGRYDLVSVHTPHLRVLLALRSLGLMSRTEVFDHNWRHLETWGGAALRRYGDCIARCAGLVLVSPRLKQYYAAHGVTPPRRTRVQTPFLPPPAAEEAGLLASYAPAVHHFVEGRAPLVVANAFQLSFYRGLDLYGLDMCVELIAELKREYPRVGLLFAMARAGDERYFAAVRRRIAELGLEENFHFMIGQGEFWPLLRRADLMVRPTSSDGYGISVAEALHFGCPAVASDVCERAPGTILFPGRDQQAFLAKCREALRAGRAPPHD